MEKTLTPTTVQEGKTLPGFDEVEHPDLSLEEMSDRIDALIARDRRQAKLAGIQGGWTPWRRMEAGEWLGAARCGSSEHARKHTKRKSTAYVSYGIDFGGKIAICEDCYKDRVGEDAEVAARVAYMKSVEGADERGSKFTVVAGSVEVPVVDPEHPPE